MTKNGKLTEHEEINRIQGKGVLYYPPGAIMHEMHIVADGGMSRRTVLEEFFLCEGGVPHRLVGGRYYFRTDDLNTWLAQNAKPHQPRRRPK